MITTSIKKLLFFSILIVGISIVCFAQKIPTEEIIIGGIEEEIIITTHYPSPVGSYNDVRLLPRPTPLDTEIDCYDMENKGVIIVTPSPNSLALVCNGEGKWIPLKGSDYWTQSGTSLYPNSNDWLVGIGTSTPGYQLEVNGRANAQELCIRYDGTNHRLCKSAWPVIDCSPDCIIGFDMRLKLGDPGYAVCGPCVPVPQASPPPWPAPPWPPRVVAPGGTGGFVWKRVCSAGMGGLCSSPADSRFLINALGDYYVCCIAGVGSIIPPACVGDDEFLTCLPGWEQPCENCSCQRIPAGYAVEGGACSTEGRYICVNCTRPTTCNSYICGWYGTACYATGGTVLRCSSP